MLRYLETFHKIRYLVSEIAIASGQRPVGNEHWKFCAKKIVERNYRYADAAENVRWIVTPTKVTAHRELLLDYIPCNKFISWAHQLVNIVRDESMLPNIYFNPALISGQDDFFSCDSHWTSLGARKYIEPILGGINISLENANLRFDDALHHGNCNFGATDPQYKEKTIHIEAPDYFEIFRTADHPVPDFSVRHGINPNGTAGRALIIHSSSYAYARGLFRSQFSSTTEVFSPYVPAKAVEEGNFDHVIVFMAERNCAVVYDGGCFGPLINNSLKVKYIKDIAHELINFVGQDGATENDEKFMRALGHAWGGREE